MLGPKRGWFRGKRVWLVGAIGVGVLVLASTGLVSAVHRVRVAASRTADL